MKKNILFLFCNLIVLLCKAQSSVDFTADIGAGQTFYFHIIDATNRYVEITQPERGPIYYDFEGSDITLPSTVIDNNTGITYTITQIGEYGLERAKFKSLILPNTIKKLGEWSFSRTNIKSLRLPEGLETIDQGAFFISNGLKTLKIPSTVRNFGVACFCQMFDLEQMDGLQELHLETIADQFFFCNYKLKMPLNFLQDVKVIEPMAFGLTPITSVTLPATVERIGFDAFRCDDLTEVYINAITPPILTQDQVFGDNTSQKIYVPADVSVTYKSAPYWKNIENRFREQVKIGPNGYTSYYLENENFEVPAGCTAYIIKTVTQQGSANLGLTTEEAFAAGSVIPKQTGFILKGTAGSTVSYRAGLTGVTEVDVTGNLLVGTATEQEISGAGYKYYLFGKGAKGQGFYHQTGRNGNSIKLAAHRAGLKLSASGPDFAPAKELIFNFDDATTTGVNNVQPVAEKKNDVIYDLQGRRVTNPSRGIYIVNGKKVVISK